MIWQSSLRLFLSRLSAAALVYAVFDAALPEKDAGGVCGAARRVIGVLLAASLLAGIIAGR